MECHCYLRNEQDLSADGHTLYERRFNSPFDGPSIPFGAEVKTYPISSKYQGRLHRFGTKTKVHLGIFIGYALNAVRTWTGGLLMVDAEDLQTIPPSETRATSRSAESCEIVRTTTSHRFSVVSFEDPPPAPPAAIASRQSERLAAGTGSFKPAPQGSHHIKVARASPMAWLEDVAGRRGRNKNRMIGEKLKLGS